MMSAQSEKRTFNFQVGEIEASTCRSHCIKATNNKKPGNIQAVQGSFIECCGKDYSTVTTILPTCPLDSI
ncbi:hypothetical protein ACM7SY_07020, partial [Enterobacter hormaechei]